MLILNVGGKVGGSDRNNISYSKKYRAHIPCSFGYKVVCVDDKFNKPVVLYRGKNAICKFIFMCTFLGIISVAYILRDQEQNYLFSLVVC